MLKRPKFVTSFWELCNLQQFRVVNRIDMPIQLFFLIEKGFNSKLLFNISKVNPVYDQFDGTSIIELFECDN